MAGNNKALKTDAGGQPAPQIYDPTADEYQYAVGQDGIQHIRIVDTSGNVTPVGETLDDVAQNTGGRQVLIEAVIVGTTAQSLTDLLSESLVNRLAIEFQNLGPGTVYVGSSGVALGTGRAIQPDVGDGSWSIPLGVYDLYLIADQNTTVIITQA